MNEEIIQIPFWKSKTFILAFIQAVAGVLLVFNGTYPDIGWIAIAKSIIDMVIRATSQNVPIGLVGKVINRRVGD
jgi:hypothetical protein